MAELITTAFEVLLRTYGITAALHEIQVMSDG
jgi:hypothetical protein